MKIIYSHPIGFVEKSGFQLIGVNLVDVKPKEELSALSQGFLLEVDKNNKLNWYQCRSTRVNVNSYTTTPYKGEWTYSTGLNAYKRMYKRFITDKGYYAHPGDDHVSDRDKLIEYSIKGTVHGISKIRYYDGAMECNLFVHDGKVRNLGKKTFAHEFYLANQLKYNYVYTGPGYEKSSIYKADYKGFEWWNGETWSTDRDEYIKLCKRDSKLKTLEDVSRIWDKV